MDAMDDGRTTTTTTFRSAEAHQSAPPSSSSSMIIKEEDVATEDVDDGVSDVAIHRDNGGRIAEEESLDDDDNDDDEEETSTDHGRGDASCNAKIGQDARSKTDKIKEVVEQAASEDSKNKIDKLLDEIHQLSDLEKLLLYLRLPTGTSVEVDPLKQAFISSLGNRFEVTQTVTWIQTHLEEDNDVSLPKQEVYDGYCEFCHRVKMKPLSTADFGKVMKQVFPGVRPRRLGTRGNSRYCYAGLRKKLLLGSPQLPDLSLTHEETCDDGDPSDPELTGVSSHLVREWAEKLLGQKFSNLRELACHLVENAYVNNRSVAAFTLLSYLSSNGLGSQSSILMNQCAGSKHRETQLQLQRKLHERELIREQKKKLMEQRSSQVMASGRGSAATASEIKGRRSQLMPVKTSSSDQCQRNISLFSPSLDNGTTPTAASKSFDFGDSSATVQTQKSCERTPPSETAKKTKTKHDDQTPAVRLFQAKSSRTMSASTSPLPKFAVVETMRSRSSSDSNRPRNSTSSATSDSDYALQHEQEQSQQHRQQFTKFSSHVPELFRSSSLGSSETAAHKTGKVRIPRVISGGGSKMATRLHAPASIIIFPQISDYNRLSPGCQASKPKYKPIQPKPIDSRCPSGPSSDDACSASTAKTLASSSTTTPSVEVESANKNAGVCPSTVSDEDQQNGREDISNSLPAGSQLPSSEPVVDTGPPTKETSLPSSRNSPVSIAVTKGRRDVQPDEKQEMYCGRTYTGNGNNKSGGRRKQVKRTSSEPKRSQNSKNKRLCLASSSALMPSNGHSTLAGAASSAVSNDQKDAAAAASPASEMSIGTLDQDAWAYLEGGVSSVDQEDELLQYFGEDGGGDDVNHHLSPVQRDFTSSATGVGGAQSTELSQLRRLLERNLLQRAAANRDDHHLDDTTITSSESMPTLRLLLSSTRQQQQQHAMEGDGITSDSCVSHTSSRMPSPNLAASGVTRSPPPPTTQYFASASLVQGDNSEELANRGMDSSLVLDTSADYAHDMSSEGLWSSQESMYSAVCKTSTGNTEEPMFSSSDSSSGCNGGVGLSTSYNPQTAVHLEDTSRTLHPLSDGGGGGGGGGGGAGGGEEDTEYHPYSNSCGGYYQEAANYVPSHQQQHHQQQQQQHQHHHQIQIQQAASGGGGMQMSSSSVPPSPNTRRRAFNFMPISPRNTPVPEACSGGSATHSASHSPLFFCTSNNVLTSGGHVQTARTILSHTAPSLSASTATSPFVSPRSTPSSNCRSRHNSGQQGAGGGGAVTATATATMSATLRATPHYMLNFGEQQLPCSMTSSPFASPHPTPVPFSRSRHNSSQNVQRPSGSAAGAGLIYPPPVTRTRHASDIGMMSSVMTSSSTSSPGAPLSPLNLHKEINSSRSRHSSNSSVPPNSPAGSSAPLSPMVNCGPMSQEVFSPGFMTSQQQQQQRHFHQTSSELERMNFNVDNSPDNNYQYSSYRHHVSTLDVVDPRINPASTSLQQYATWPLRQPLSLQMDPRLVSRQRHASMGATVHHYPLPPPPRPAAPTAPAADVANVVTKKPPPAPLPLLVDAMAASRCRSVPIYQMLENAIQHPDSASASQASAASTTHVNSHYDDVIMSKSYPATPIGQQQSFNFDPRMSSADYSPMVGGGDGGGVGVGKDQDGAAMDVVSTLGSGATEPQPTSQAPNGDTTLEMPANDFQDMLNTTLEDLTYDDDISKFAQELDQYDP